MTQVFVDVDTQRDFLDPAGALYIQGSPEILANLARLSNFARARGIPVIATACAHGPDDEEFQVFPPHCVNGTEGQRRIEATRFEESSVLPVGASYDGRVAGHLTINKQKYDVFHRPEAEAVFARYADVHSPIFVVYGVATDYCVKCVVEGLLARGHRVEVVVDAVRAVNAAAEAEVLTRFVELGAVLTLTDAVCA